MDNYTFYGTIEEPKEIDKTRKVKTMRERHGTDCEHQCKDCEHFVRLVFHTELRFKCNLWRISKSKHTNLKPYDMACNKFKG